MFLDGKPAGTAAPFVIGRHVHRAVAQADVAADPDRDRDRLPGPGRRRPRGSSRDRREDRLHPARHAPRRPAPRTTTTDSRPRRSSRNEPCPRVTHFDLSRTPPSARASPPQTSSLGRLTRRRSPASTSASRSLCSAYSPARLVSGKTVARAPLAPHSWSRPPIRSSTSPTHHSALRGLYVTPSSPLSRRPASFLQSRGHGHAQRPARRRGTAERQTSRRPHPRLLLPPALPGSARGDSSAHQRRDGFRSIHSPSSWSVSPPSTASSASAFSPPWISGFPPAPPDRSYGSRRIGPVPPSTI